MSQNIYDRPDFFERYGQLRRSLEGLDGAPEWPAMRAMLPPLRDAEVADLGCGYGWFCRWARGQGARHVLGLDISQAMLARAAATTDDAAITYRRADMDQLELPPTAFDVVYSSLAFHYIADAARLYAAIHHALKPGGALVFSTEHPILMAPSRPGWSIDAEGRRTWPIDRYFDEGPRTTDWLAKGVIKHHRTIGTTLTLLLRAGFTLEHVEEFCPTGAQIGARPELLEERERPMFLLVAARRASSTVEDPRTEAASS